MIFRGLGFLLVLSFAAASFGQTKRTEHVGLPAVRATDEVVVVLAEGIDPVIFGYANRLEPIRQFESIERAFLYRTTAADSRPVSKLLLSKFGVKKAYANKQFRRVKHGFTPNDPYFFSGVPTSEWPGQWHLKNDLTLGLDINVATTWNQGFAGNSIVVGVIDDGVEVTHPDLIVNTSGANAWDWVGNDSNPAPGSEDDTHGTAIAGLIAARGGNSIGTTGVAPLAKIAGLRVDLFGGSAQQFADATLYKSIGSSPTIRIKAHCYGVIDTCLDQGLERDALETSAAAGTIHIFSAGNDRGTFLQDSNKMMLPSSPEAIAVGAVGSNGKFASTSNFGANLFCVAPSGVNTLLGLTTTDRVGELNGYNGADLFPNGDYTADFGGTSAAAALVAGVMALGEQVNPELNVRLAKHMLARTSGVVDPSDATFESDGGWITNDAGLKFNQNYGFGLIDASAFTTLLKDYVGVTPLVTESVSSTIVDLDIPDNSPDGLTRTFEISATAPLEEILVTLVCTHPFRGDIEAFLTSPKGTRTRLTLRGDDNNADLNWTFCANAFWGESPSGTWTLNVADRSEFDTGTWDSFAVTARMGKSVGIDKPTALLVSPNSVFGGTSVTGRIDLFGPARAGGAVVTLRSSSGAASVPASITVPAGATSGTFTISTNPVSTNVAATITATRLSISKTASLTVRVPIPTAVTLAQASVQGGTRTSATVTVNAPALGGGLRVDLSSNVPSATVPSYIYIPSGQTSASFYIGTLPVNVNTAAKITATVAGAAKPVILTVRPAAVSTVTVNPASVFGGESAQVTINLTGIVPPDGGPIAISTNFPGIVSVPSSVSVPGGASSVTFTVGTYPVGASTRTQVYAVRGGVSKGVSLMVVRPSIESLTVEKVILAGGETTQATVTLNAPAPEMGIPASITTTDPVLQIPSSVRVPNGERSVTFNVGSNPVTATKASVLRATVNGVIKGVSISVRINTVAGINFTPSTIRKGASTNGLVQMTMPAGAGGNMITLTSSSVLLPVTSPMFVAPGTSSRSFLATAGNVVSSTLVTVTASYGGLSQTTTVTLNP